MRKRWFKLITDREAFLNNASKALEPEPILDNWLAVSGSAAPSQHEKTHLLDIPVVELEEPAVLLLIREAHVD